MHTGCVYICKLNSVRNVPKCWNLTICTLKSLKQCHFQFQPLPASALPDNFQALIWKIIRARAHIQQVVCIQQSSSGKKRGLIVRIWATLCQLPSVPKNGHSHARFTQVAAATVFCPFLVDEEAR